MVINEIDDRAVLTRERAQALAQYRAAMLVRPGCFRIGSGIARVYFFRVERGIAPAPQFLERLEAGNGKQPGRRSGAAPKFVCTPPNREKNLAGEVVAARRIAKEAQDEPIDARLVAREEGVHGEPIAGCDPRYQRGVRHVTSRARQRREAGTADSPVNSGRFATVHIDLPLKNTSKHRRIGAAQSIAPKSCGIHFWLAELSEGLELPINV
jgi:hypothetical protein